MSCIIGSYSTLKLIRGCDNYRISIGKRTRIVESSLKQSKNIELKRILTSENTDIKAAVADIIRIKNINIYVHTDFESNLSICLQQICGHKKLISSIINLRKTPYRSEDLQHEKRLNYLWQLLKPDEFLENRISKQWTSIGFQGSDPKTDFRGMGILGLENLIFFAENYNLLARKILLESNNPKFEYSFAIVGINITSLVVQLLNENCMKYHFYNTVFGQPSINDFHFVYVCIFKIFHQNWIADQPGIMNFNIYKEKFHKHMASRLKKPDAYLKLEE